MYPTIPYIQTSQGINFTFTEPNLDDIDIKDIAHSLSMQCRFNGHTRLFYSVAEHCINAARLVPNEFKLAALLHDASEAYITDIATPVKRMLPDYLRLEQVVQGAIDKKFGFTVLAPEVIQADKAALVAEAEKLLPTGPDHWIHDERYKSIYKLDPKYVMCLPPLEARNLFLLRYEQFLKGIFVSAAHPVPTIHPRVALRALS